MKNSKIYQERRQKLIQQLPSNSVVFVPAARELIRNGDVHYRFRQDSDFYYLTGFNEPDAVLILFSGESPQSILFNRKKDPLLEQWTGKRLGQEGACRIIGVNTAYAIDDYEDKLPEMLANKHSIYFPVGRYPEFDQQMLEAWNKVKGQVRSGTGTADSFCDSTAIIGQMRLIKSSVEIAAMQCAATASVAAHERAMRACKHAKYEYEIEAELSYELTRRGCRGHAYDPIVASGDNACILHYIDNDQPIQDNALILIDAGGEYQNYASDITRTFPVNGTFSSEQKAIYEIVLTAQKAAIECIRPGASWDDMQQVTIRVLTEGLLDLGLLKGSLENLIEKGSYKPFYMHRFGHWLGLDVHDCGRYKDDNKWCTLEPDMVFTVEPGIYISKDTPGVDKRWWGIGIRIEDDIHVTENGHKNLSGALVKEVDELEAFLRD